MNTNLVRVAELICRETGISIKAAQLPSLGAALKRVDPDKTVGDFLLAGAGSGGGAALLERMIDEVTIRETFFFRQRSELDAIDWPRLVAAARASGSDHARVWVAAAASGEEAYTLAILASEAFAPSPPPVTIHGTDVSASALAQAERGRYGRRSTKGVERSLLDRYFTMDGPDFLVGEGLRRTVTFSQQNLARNFIAATGGPFDLIACRNVLIYFEPDVVRRVVTALTRALAPQGRLLLGAADRLSFSASTPVRPADRRASEGGRRQEGTPVLRRPLGRDHRDTLSPATATPPASLNGPELAEALQTTSGGDLQKALAITARTLDQNPLDTAAYFVRGLAQRGLGHHGEALCAFRTALYIDPAFGLAAYEMGRAYEACGDEAAAARAYNQALGGLEPKSGRIRKQIVPRDVARACAIRLRALGFKPAGPSDPIGGGPA